MVIHSYLTDGFFSFGKSLLLSFKRHHGEEIPFLLSTRNLSKAQIDELHRCYKRLFIFNAEIDMVWLSKETGIDIKTLLKYKWQVENIYVKPESTIWKQFISVEDRYKNAVYEAYNMAPNFLIHMDVDSLINRPLDPLFDIVKDHDVSAIFRLGHHLDRMKVFGCLMGFRVGQPAYTFLETWRKNIDAISLVRKPRGYGQTSFYHTYQELKGSGISWGRIPRSFVQPGAASNALILQGNNGKSKSAASKDFARMTSC
jgi:hypothetical protein